MSLDLKDWQKKKYTTRDGRPVRILCIDGPGLYPIVGVLLIEDKINLKPITWTIKGDYSIDSAFMDENKLINAKTKKEGWVNVYRNIYKDSLYVHSPIYPSIESAGNNDAYRDRIACVKIEWEE